ncbi:MAG: OmpA family protein [Rubrivivax sp.]
MLRRLAPLALAAAIATGAFAQAAPETPDTRSMIEALKPMTTRSLRNLVVRPAAASAPEAAPASAPTAPQTAAPAPAAEPAAPAEAPSLSLAILFDFGAARIQAASVPTLENLAAAMQAPELAASRFRIEGHTDAKGAAAVNLRLSRARADEVRRFLVAHGVAAARLQSVGLGSSQPADPADPLAAANRRVRIVNLP